MDTIISHMPILHRYAIQCIVPPARQVRILYVYVLALIGFECLLRSGIGINIASADHLNLPHEDMVASSEVKGVVVLRAARFNPYTDEVRVAAVEHVDICHDCAAHCVGILNDDGTLERAIARRHPPVWRHTITIAPCAEHYAITCCCQRGTFRNAIPRCFDGRERLHAGCSAVVVVASHGVNPNVRHRGGADSITIRATRARPG